MLKTNYSKYCTAIMGSHLPGCQTMHFNVWIVILLIICTTLSSSMPNNDGSQEKGKRTDSVKPVMPTMPPSSTSTNATMLTTDVPPVDTGIVEGNTDETRRVLYHRQMNDNTKFRLSTPSDTNDQSTKETEIPDYTTSESYSENENSPENQTSNVTHNDDHLSTPPSINQSDPWKPYSLSPNYMTNVMHAQPRAAVPPVSLINEPIQEGDAEPARGRSGSPRRIDIFPPLQNQPGHEYMDALIRRTLTPAKSTTPMTPLKDKDPFKLQKNIPVTSTTSIVDKTITEYKDAASTGASNRRMNEASDTSELPPLLNIITTTNGHPSIETAFSLNEDFTDAHLEMKFEHDATLFTEPSITKHNLAIHSKEVSSSPNATQKVLSESNGTTDSSKLVDSTIRQTSTTAPKTTIRNSENKTATNVAQGTNLLPTTARAPTNNNIKNITDVFIDTTTVAVTDATKLKITTALMMMTTTHETPVPTTVATTTTTTTTATTTTTTKQMTSTRARHRTGVLPTWRARSPSPSIRKKLSQSTTTQHSIPTTAHTEEPIDKPESTDLEEEIGPEFEASLPPYWPPEPTTTRRQYLMTMPPLVDGYGVHQGGVEGTDDNTINMHMESTHVILPTEKSGGGIIPEGATNAIIISGIIGGCAILFFAVLMIFCMWRQYVSRRPIYPPPESSNSSSSSGFSGKLG